MTTHFLKKFLPFALTLLVGVAAYHAFPLVWRERVRQEASSTEVAPAAPGESAPRELPELHVLSPMLMSEALEFERRGGGYESPRVTSPAGAQYSAAHPQAYSQGVLQLSFAFGADGRVSEITPLGKRHDCGLCLRGPNVFEIDASDPLWSAQVDAAEEAVRRIEFVPGTNGGRPVDMHGLAECVFRLD